LALVDVKMGEKKGGNCAEKGGGAGGKREAHSLLMLMNAEGVGKEQGKIALTKGPPEGEELKG